jgi:hypothetical protein
MRTLYLIAIICVALAVAQITSSSASSETSSDSVTDRTEFHVSAQEDKDGFSYFYVNKNGK